MLDRDLAFANFAESKVRSVTAAVEDEIELTNDLIERGEEAFQDRSKEVMEQMIGIVRRRTDIFGVEAPQEGVVVPKFKLKLTEDEGKILSDLQGKIDLLRQSVKEQKEVLAVALEPEPAESYFASQQKKIEALQGEQKQALEKVVQLVTDQRIALGSLRELVAVSRRELINAKNLLTEKRNQLNSQEVIAAREALGAKRQELYAARQPERYVEAAKQRLDEQRKAYRPAAKELPDTSEGRQAEYELEAEIEETEATLKEREKALREATPEIEQKTAEVEQAEAALKELEESDREVMNAKREVDVAKQALERAEKAEKEKEKETKVLFVTEGFKAQEKELADLEGQLKAAKEKLVAEKRQLFKSMTDKLATLQEERRQLQVTKGRRSRKLPSLVHLRKLLAESLELAVRSQVSIPDGLSVLMVKGQLERAFAVDQTQMRLLHSLEPTAAMLSRAMLGTQLAQTGLKKFVTEEGGISPTIDFQKVRCALAKAGVALTRDNVGAFLRQFDIAGVSITADGKQKLLDELQIDPDVLLLAKADSGLSLTRQETQKLLDTLQGDKSKTDLTRKATERGLEFTEDQLREVQTKLYEAQRTFQQADSLRAAAVARNSVSRAEGVLGGHEKAEEASKKPNWFLRALMPALRRVGNFLARVFGFKSAPKATKLGAGSSELEKPLLPKEAGRSDDAESAPKPKQSQEDGMLELVLRQTYHEVSGSWKREGLLPQTTSDKQKALVDLLLDSSKKQSKMYKYISGLNMDFRRVVVDAIYAYPDLVDNTKVGLLSSCRLLEDALAKERGASFQGQKVVHEHVAKLAEKNKGNPRVQRMLLRAGHGVQEARQEETSKQDQPPPTLTVR